MSLRRREKAHEIFEIWEVWKYSEREIGQGLHELLWKQTTRYNQAPINGCTTLGCAIASVCCTTACTRRDKLRGCPRPEPAYVGLGSSSGPWSTTPSDWLTPMGLAVVWRGLVLLAGTSTRTLNKKGWRTYSVYEVLKSYQRQKGTWLVKWVSSWMNFICM